MLLFDESLRKIDYIFRMTGMHLNNRKNFNLKRARIIFYFNFFISIYDLFGATYFFIRGLYTGEDVTLVIYAISCIIMGMLSYAKSVSSVVHHKYIDEIVFMLRDLETRSNLKDHVNENIKESIKFLHLVLKVQNYCNWVLIIVFPLMPLSLTAYIYFTSNDIVLLLPFYAVYPFDAYSINYWPIILIKQIWTGIMRLTYRLTYIFIVVTHFHKEGFVRVVLRLLTINIDAVHSTFRKVILTVLYVFGADALYYICCTFIHVQFKLLQQEIQGSIPESLPYDGREGFGREVDEALTLKIAKLVTWHQDIIKAVGLVEKINSKTTLFNFLCSSFLICLTGFTVTEIDGMYVVSFVTFLGICFFQIFFLCLFGDLIEQSSAEVSNAVYESKWNLTSIQHSKELYIIMMRAQKSCKLTAYGFAEVNLTAFTKIMNTAMSYFTLLKTVR